MNSKGQAPVFLRITINGQKTEISTGINIPPRLWDNKKATIKGSSNEVKEMNKKLEVTRTKANKIFNELMELDLPVSVELIKQRMSNDDAEIKTLMEAMRYHNNMLHKRIGIDTTKATHTKYETLRKKIEAFLTLAYNRKDMFLKELKNQFVIEFETFLKTEHLISHNPTIKYIQFLKKIIHVAIANGWLVSDPFKNFKCSLITKERGYLTIEEIQTLQVNKINIKRLEVVKDLFVFSCYTGLSYSDVKKLSYSHIEAKGDGSKWIVINRTKTGNRSAIPILPAAEKLLNKYAAPFIPDKDGRVFPVMSNQKMNAYLKEIGDIYGIAKPLTFHLARHSFATSVTLTHGVPIESVSKMLGHTNLKTTQVYAKVVDMKVQDDMKRLKERLDNRVG